MQIHHISVLTSLGLLVTSWLFCWYFFQPMKPILISGFPPQIFFYILFLKLYSFLNFWLCWVFVAARRLSLVVANGGYSLVLVHGLLVAMACLFVGVFCCHLIELKAACNSAEHFLKCFLLELPGLHTGFPPLSQLTLFAQNSSP